MVDLGNYECMCFSFSLERLWVADQSECKSTWANVNLHSLSVDLNLDPV